MDSSTRLVLDALLSFSGGATADRIGASGMAPNPVIVICGNRTLWAVSMDYIRVRLGSDNYGIFMFRYRQAYEFLNEGV